MAKKKGIPRSIYCDQMRDIAIGDAVDAIDMAAEEEENSASEQAAAHIPTTNAPQTEPPMPATEVRGSRNSKRSES